MANLTITIKVGQVTVERVLDAATALAAINDYIEETAITPDGRLLPDDAPNKAKIAWWLERQLGETKEVVKRYRARAARQAAAEVNL